LSVDICQSISSLKGIEFIRKIYGKNKKYFIYSCSCACAWYTVFAVDDSSSIEKALQMPDSKHYTALLTFLTLKLFFV
jgi:hypothetical protein